MTDKKDDLDNLVLLDSKRKNKEITPKLDLTPPPRTRRSLKDRLSFPLSLLVGVSIFTLGGVYLAKGCESASGDNYAERRMVAEVDKNYNGSVTGQEFLTAYKCVVGNDFPPSQGRILPNMVVAFNVDSDHQGIISRQEGYENYGVLRNNVYLSRSVADRFIREIQQKNCFR